MFTSFYFFSIKLYPSSGLLGFKFIFIVLALLWLESDLLEMTEKIEIGGPIEAQDNDSDRFKGKSGVLHIEDNQDHHLSKAEQITAVDAAVANPNVSLESFAHLDIKKILWRIDVRIVPVLTILYLLAFLDRGNIGNAKIEGLSEDLHLTGGQYNWALTAFFFTYCAFEVSILCEALHEVRSKVTGPK